MTTTKQYKSLSVVMTTNIGLLRAKFQEKFNSLKEKLEKLRKTGF